MTSTVYQVRGSEAMASSTAAAVKASGDEQGASFGILIVGIGGNNGVTLLAGIQANQQVS